MSPSPCNEGNGGKNDPVKDSDEVDVSDVPAVHIIAAMESSSDDDELENATVGIGYQLLPQGPDVAGYAGLQDDSDDDGDDDMTEAGGYDDSHRSSHDMSDNIPDLDDEENSIQHIMPHLQVPSLGENVELKDLKELWKTPRHVADITPMDEEEADKIKLMMAGFSLPPSNLPDWADVIPEAEWKSRLISRIVDNKSSTDSASSTTDSAPESNRNASEGSAASNTVRSEIDSDRSGGFEISESDMNDKQITN